MYRIFKLFVYYVMGFSLATAVKHAAPTLFDNTLDLVATVIVCALISMAVVNTALPDFDE